MTNHGRHGKHEKMEAPDVAKSASERASDELGFAELVAAIRQVHEHCAAHVRRTVNVSLTLRNWVIGAYIRQYEQQGADRATYGARLLDNLAEALQVGLDRSYTGRCLGLCRQLFDMYPEIQKSVISESGGLDLPWAPPATVSEKSQKSPIRDCPRGHKSKWFRKRRTRRPQCPESRLPLY